MTDPLSISVGVLQIASFTGTLVRSIGRFVEQTRTISDSIHELYDEMRLLEEVLRDIGETFAKRPQQLSFEYRHHNRIHRILESCRASLQDLEVALPQLADDSSAIDKLKLSIQKSLKGERLKQIVHHISSYTRVLQLSLSTLSLGELWINRRSQDMILAKVQDIYEDMRSKNIFLGRIKKRGMVPEIINGAPTTRPYTPPADYEEGKLLLDKELRDWRETVDEVTAAVSLSIPDQESCDGRPAMAPHTSASSTTLQILEDDVSDSEQEELDEVNRSILQLTLENNQKLVNQLSEIQIYFQAAKYHRRAINICRRLNDGATGPDEQTSDTEYATKLANMRESFADILLKCDTTVTDDEAEEVLEQLLNEETERLEATDADRRWRLYHKLGSLYASQGNFLKSRRYLKQAFMGRSRADPRSQSLVIESAEMLIKSLQVLQRIDEVRGTQDWLKKEFPSESPALEQPSVPPSPGAITNPSGNLPNLYTWCVEQGFDVNSRRFGFDICDSGKGKAPIHQAVQDENFEILQHMVQNVAHVEQRDATGSTPIHLAAATRSKRICTVLLEKDVVMDVLDRSDRSPLHRCQCSSGGTEVAKLILNRCPELIDRIDGFGKTALYMACEKGNEKMAELLLLMGANPNKYGQGQFIPLVSAIDAAARSRNKIHLVKLLLEHGADPGIRDGSGRTAFEAANNAGLAGSEIKRLLGEIFTSRPAISSRFPWLGETG
ncbi:ankyrin [Xylariaceae sp. FL1651]|nr:ankyrin [Xylariaceae sp. FL1651]